MRPQHYPTPSPRAPGSPALWLSRLRRLQLHLADTGQDEQHPAAEAAVGRYWALTRRGVPQRGSAAPSAVAWHRASGAQPGYRNRRARKALHAARQALTGHSTV